MKRPIRKIIDYFVLSIFVSIAIILVLLFNGSKVYQAITVICVSLLYILWGILHHLREHTFHLNIMLEYLLFALLGSFIVIGLL
ncbi:MAG: hypothetical protein UW68_C0003G0022 [Candidatus Collierbacteria bacterium GW2011_GWB1_44_6]|uniref:Uncharacterized protein n=2 Tax=Candidatus Collieribacteriota TaxID=1752725 RepID=A0A0G1JQ90_9BACT|nr:MAG: hypothetical protein UV68_C0025G0007 [Candidatus Collierbacteria bacterium GW2011_GWC2_43_12]KKT73701.1 MAG: hypothetical protein UW68_C0003G0022 [Candidatus Collierbacteria bacterium GW2011_GWB1_44_6]KKT83469.1 MAG: hypothetical protein UW80_C0013G0009 [Microgenomates group bacterium GW2011_GWC1_44_9]